MSQYPTYKLGEIAEIILGQSPESKSYNTKGEGLPFFQGKTEFTDWSPIPKKWCTEPKKIAEPLDILLSVRAPVGPTNIAKEKCCIGRGLAAIRYTDCYKYVLYYLRSVCKYLESKATGTTFQAISGDVIKKLPIPLPPLATQRAIVTRIESLFAELDKGVEKLKTAQQRLKVYRQAVLNDALTKGGKEWKVVKVGNVAEIKGGKRLPKGHSYADVPTKYRYIMAGNLKNNTVVLDTNYLYQDTYEALKHYEVLGGEVYITIVGACIGDTGVIPMNLGKSILTENAAKMVNLKGVLSPFLSYSLQSSYTKNQIKSKILSATLGKLALSRVAEIEFLLPPLSIQQRIVQEIETRLSACDEVEKNINESLQQAEALRQSILKKAFSGELV